MKLGFTGTRNGMTERQRAVFIKFVHQLKPTEWHQGDCIGSDAEADNEVAAIMGDRCIRHAHPGPLTPLSANQPADVRHPSMGYFARNRIIVYSCDTLIATPPAKPLPTQGGTAYTVNYARKVDRQYVIIFPDGTLEVGMKGGKSIEAKTADFSHAGQSLLVGYNDLTITSAV